jgi:hypothetical protein
MKTSSIIQTTKALELVGGYVYDTSFITFNESIKNENEPCNSTIILTLNPSHNETL